MSNDCACRQHRQRRTVTIIVIEASVQWLNLMLYMVPNALLPAQPSYHQHMVMVWLCSLDMLEHCEYALPSHTALGLKVVPAAAHHIAASSSPESAMSFFCVCTGWFA